MSSLKFNNRFTQQLPADSETSNFVRQVSGACFSWVKPTQVCNPQLISVSPDVVELLGMSITETQSEWFLQAFSGNQLLPQMKSYAMCYGGHQFGHWAGQLGDGRAINLAEVVDIHGKNQTLQLKGAGLTPYSRTADGLAVLRSSVREFLCSEAMYYLGVPTTRALSLMLSGEQVWRDMFYDGNPQQEPGAIVCRVAPSFVRFGNFQILAARQEQSLLKQLMDYTISYDFPHLGAPDIEVYEQWFREICQLTLQMIVNWMRVGFVHGVMNTDNMSILGLTIDYGPYGWLENYDPQWTPNTTDAKGRRYSFGNQPGIAQWNLFQLANAIAPVIGRADALEEALQEFGVLYTQLSHSMYCQKLGLSVVAEQAVEHKQQSELISQLLDILTLSEIDMTIFFRLLSGISQNMDESFTDNHANWMDFFEAAIYQPIHFKDNALESLNEWMRGYIKQINQQPITDEQRQTQMNQVNPKFVLRNYLAQQAIDKAANGDYSEIEKLLKIMQKPYDEQPENVAYAKKRPDWAKQKAGCSMLSCSS
ncbi:protein adenylyltransferase SelO [Aliikangiella maris]|uniref:Protein adenylyltransferase SelO n=2 Tax=Aliikangiella maris TaxID=3162458 RepID=A0ABV3MRR0_9GAMM